MPRGTNPRDAALDQARLWTPAALGGQLAIWNEARLPHVTLVSGAASEWRSVNGSGRDWLQTTSGARPAWSPDGFAPGVPGLTFDGADDFMEMTTASISQPFVVVMAARITANNNDRHLLDGTSGGSRILLGQSGGAWVTFSGSAVLSGPAFDTNSNVFTAIYNGGSSSLAINGTVVATGNPGSNVWSGQTLFKPLGFLPPPGVCYGMALSTDVSQATANRLTGYFAWQSNTQSRLAASHPFRNAPPLI